MDIYEEQIAWWKAEGFMPYEAYEALTGIFCQHANWIQVRDLMKRKHASVERELYPAVVDGVRIYDE